VKRRTCLTYANVMATIAVFLALGGSSYAALKISGKQVADHSLTGRDIKNGSLKSRQIKNRSLLARDFKAGQLPTGAQGSQGVQGPKGDKGDKGGAGPPGPTFGETTNATSSVTGCGPSTLATMTVTVSQPSRILAAASGAWERNSTNLDTATLTAVLLQDDTIVARSVQGFASDFATGVQRIGVSLNAVLFAGNSSFPATETAYVAQPGTYTLRLDGGASDGNCTGTSTFWRAYLTYVLLGTTP
jgi:hypothetical protein